MYGQQADGCDTQALQVYKRCVMTQARIGAAQGFRNKGVAL